MARVCIGQGFRLLLVVALFLAPVAHAAAALAEVPRATNYESELHSADHHILGEIGDCDGCCHATLNAGCALMCANGGAILAEAISATGHGAQGTIGLEDVLGAGLPVSPDLHPPRPPACTRLDDVLSNRPTSARDCLPTREFDARIAAHLSFRETVQPIW